jgi:hypothetical protein
MRKYEEREHVPTTPAGKPLTIRLEREGLQSAAVVVRALNA